MEEDFFTDPEPILSTLAQVFASEGAAREVAVIATSLATIKQTGYDNWDGGTYTYSLYLQVPSRLYTSIFADLAVCETLVLEKAQIILRPYKQHHLERVGISPSVSVESGWRDKAIAWVAGDGVSNQGRVRSSNIASRTEDGLLFRSEPEIFLYKALKGTGVSFAPLPVFVRGGETYQRIEPDFVLLKDGIMLIVEVDGDTVHHETPAEAHARTAMLAHEGAFIERVKASECNTQEAAKSCARKVLGVIDKLKTQR